ncbi:MAG: adenylate/guanylate cyclase domain-containing protein [Anaerolineae bacterium]
MAGERRDVTVLFLDISNFTTASYYLDSEEVYIFIDEAMSLLVEVLQKYDGTVDKFTGDGLMALFGAPLAHENDPERAIRAALEMQYALKPLQRRLKESYDIEFEARIGINTGPVIAGNLGSDFHMEYTVIGDTVNLASRLETAARPGTILVSEDTYHHTRPIFEFETLDPMSVKGIPEPIQAFRPVGILKNPGRLRGLSGLEVPMVGRAELLDRMVEALKQSQEQQERQVVFITGEAGVGKSRLIAEFEKSLSESEAKIFQGSCLDYARSNPLWVVTDLVKDILRFSEGMSDSLQRKILQNHLDQQNLSTDEVLPYLSYILDLVEPDSECAARLEHLDPTVMQRQTYAALRQFLIAEIGQTPTVFIFEDLHWVDSASRDFLEFLMQSSHNCALLLVLVSRSKERETLLHPLFDAALRDGEHMVDLQLQSLSEVEAQQLIDSLILPTDPVTRQLKRTIVKRAAGNPFYVEEIVRMLISQGGMIHLPATNQWDITPQAAQKLKSMPGTIKGLILARFDQLPEGLRQSLQKAAIIGHTISPRLLEKLKGVSQDIVNAHLEELVKRQFLTRRQSGDEQGYAFEHALIQEAVYSTLLSRDRRQLHTRVAQVIADDPTWQGNTRSEALAFHLTRSSKPQQAIPYLIATADRASRRCAYEVAVEHYRQARELMGQDHIDYGRDFFEVHINLGRALKFLGDFSEAHQIISDTIKLIWHNNLSANPISLSSILIEGMVELADVEQREGNYDEAVDYLNSGLQLLGEQGEQEHPITWSFLMDRLAWVRFRQGRLEDAEVVAKAAAETIIKNELENPIRLATIFNTLGGVAWKQGNQQQAISHVEQSLQLYDSVGYLWGRSVAYANLGVLNYGLGNWMKARYYYKQAYNLQQTIGDLPHQAISLENLGLLDVAMGKHETGRRELEQSLAVRTRLGDTWGMAQAEVNLAVVAVRANGNHAASVHAKNALILGETIGDDEIQVNANWVIGLTMSNQGDVEAGLAITQKALGLAREGSYKDAEIDCLQTLGIIHLQAGNPQAALQHLDQALALSTKTGARYAQAKVHCELARVHRALIPNKTAAEKAEYHLYHAIEEFKSLGATHDLSVARAELDQLETQTPR